uniref:Uncharacterized protein n=1 Tax=Medicago truncatula TaxID=3880 RepID=Q2HTY0_MEDTR|nr:hypothetical protein MtrDRAFT_AC149577g27v1 [Medicago truncatula]
MHFCKHVSILCKEEEAMESKGVMMKMAMCKVILNLNVPRAFMKDQVVGNLNDTFSLLSRYT